MAAARVQKEIKRLAKSPPPGISAWPANENSITQLQVQMQGPPDTPYELGLFRLEVCLPPRYPFEPPKVQFQTPVYHPNIDAQGRICLDVLNMPPKGSWGPALDLCKVLMAVRQLLAEPNPKDPLAVDIAEECASQPELFKVKARQHVAQHARPAAATAAAAPVATQQRQQQEAAGMSTAAQAAAAADGAQQPQGAAASDADVGRPPEADKATDADAAAVDKQPPGGTSGAAASSRDDAPADSFEGK